MEPFVPLFTKSNFSFLEGASHPEELIERTHELGLPCLALTDRDGVFGLPRAHVRAEELGVKLILGAQVTLLDGALVVMLAQDRKGYGNVCHLLSKGRLRCGKGQSAVTLDEVCAHAEGTLVLWGARCLQRPQDALALQALRETFGDRVYALLTRHQAADDVEREAFVRKHATRTGTPLVAAVEVLYHTPARRRLQDVLTAIRQGVPLHACGTALAPNANHALLAPRAMHALFEDDAAAVQRTREVAARCTFSFREIRYRYPSERLPDGTTSAQWLRQLAYQGAHKRYGEPIPAAITAQLDKELALIEELDYPGYFLTMHEIVAFCRDHNILCQGRGSAANSAVCFCLGVTAVDPAHVDLLFERFLSRERAEPPDIDLDIEHARREEVIQHVYAKYGRRHAAMVANVNRYRMRSAIRDVGKALGIAETALDQLSKLGGRHDGDWPAMLRGAGLDPNSTSQQHLVALVEEIQDFPRHLSQHPGGFLLGHEPVDTLVPIENAAMADRTVIQWDKNDVEILGLFKVDLLGLGALTLVHQCFDLLRAHRAIDLDMARLPADDPATYDMFCKGDTVGVFQIESRAQMAMLPRLRPRTFYDLVIEVSIVRPGPIAGDMVHPYLRRRHGEEEVTYAHACLVPVLRKTLGVPLFQEQVMKLAMVAADYTPGEADQLRRDMAAWRRTGRLERHRERLISRMCSKGITPAFAERVFEQIKGFGEYGFPESHAASFALIAYATGFLRVHYLDAFTCALLNAQPMGFYSVATIVEDAKRHGLEVRAVDVNQSAWDCTLEGDRNGAGADQGATAPAGTLLALRMGLRWVKGLAEADGKRIASAAPFVDLRDFARRTGLDQRKLQALAEAGALLSIAPSRRAALWDVLALAHEPKDLLPLRVAEPAPAFAALDPFEEITWDYRTTYHSPRGHPLAPLRQELRHLGLPPAHEVTKKKDGQRARYAGLVICRQRPGTAKGVTFLTLEDETGFVNVVVWQKLFDRFALLLKTAVFLGVTGKLQRQDGVVHVIADSLWEPRVTVQPATGGSRDFC
jgi:error-prone DNA polymerase